MPSLNDLGKKSEYDAKTSKWKTNNKLLLIIMISRAKHFMQRPSQEKLVNDIKILATKIEIKYLQQRQN